MRSTTLAELAAVTICAVVVVGTYEPAAANPAPATMLLPFTGAGCVDCSECSANNEQGNKAFVGDETSVADAGSGTHTTCKTAGGWPDQHAKSNPIFLH